jgi:large subunit ribosomal protein L45
MTKSITPPAFASQARGQQIRAFLKSPGVIADPYRGPRPWPALGSFFGGDGWRALGKSMLRPIQDVWTLGQCQSIKGFSRTQFREEARTLYKEINRMISLNNHTALRHVCSERAMTEIKREVKAREKGGWDRIEWNLLAFDANTPTVVQGRTIAPNEQDRSVSFAQFTVVFRTKQTWTAYDKKGRIVAGDDAEVLNVEDVWVFEHGLKVPNPRWRLAARLSVGAPGGTTTVGGAALDPNVG